MQVRQKEGRWADKFLRAERRWKEWRPQLPTAADCVIPKIIEEKARLLPNHPVLQFRDVPVTYEQLRDGMARLAAGFSALGIGLGDKVGLILPNSLAFLESWFGANVVGAVAVPVNTAQRGEGLLHQIIHAQCKVVVIAVAFLPHLEQLADRLIGVQHIIVYGGDTEPSSWSGIELLDYAALRAASARMPKQTLSPADLSTISYTSGTTGRSKGVMMSQNYWVEIWSGALRFARLTDQDVHYCALPFFHSSAQAIIGPTLLSGARAIIVERFSASAMLDDCRRWGCTTTKYVGSIIPILMKQPERRDDAENPLRLMVGAAAPRDLLVPFERRFGTRLLELYGMTECNACLVNPYDARKLGACGKPSPGWDVRLVDEDDRPVPLGAIGEIVARPLKAGLGTSGYYNDPTATAELFRDGWIHTGDLGRQDEEGYFFFVDRRKQALRRRGENISSFEVESVINGHPAVLESAVVGVPSDLGEEEVKAVVRLRPGSVMPPQALIDWCETRLPYFALPRYVCFRDTLPRTPSERIEKYRLKAEGVTADCWDREKECDIPNASR